MNARRRSEDVTREIKTGPIGEACLRYGYGETLMRSIAKDAGAVIRIGRTMRINFTKVDAYLDSMSGE